MSFPNNNNSQPQDAYIPHQMAPQQQPTSALYLQHPALPNIPQLPIPAAPFQTAPIPQLSLKAKIEEFEKNSASKLRNALTQGLVYSQLLSTSSGNPMFREFLTQKKEEIEPLYEIGPSEHDKIVELFLQWCKETQFIQKMAYKGHLQQQQQRLQQQQLQQLVASTAHAAATISKPPGTTLITPAAPAPSGQKSIPQIHNAYRPLTKEEEQEYFPKPRLDAFLKEITEPLSMKYEPEVENVMKRLASDFVDSAASSTVSMAKAKKAKHIDAETVATYFKMTRNITVPGARQGNVPTYTKPMPSEAHKARMAAMRKANIEAGVQKFGG